MRKTKIVCTIGPASETEEILVGLCKAGMNVARFNFSHGDHAEQKGRMDLLKQIREEEHATVAILLDTKGPEIRLGTFVNGKEVLEDGAQFTLTTEEIEGTNRKVSITYKELRKDVQKGSTVLINDGLIELRVEDITDTDIVCRVIHGGMVSDRKGINVPGVELTMPYLSEVDTRGILFAIENGFDFIAASFVSGVGPG